VGQAATVREKLGAVLYPMGQFDAALAECERAAETYRLLGDVEGRARATAQIGHMHALRTTPEEGVARVQACLATLGSQDPSAGQAARYAALARLLLATCRGAERESVAAAERAAELARVPGSMFWIRLRDWRARILTQGRNSCALPAHGCAEREGRRRTSPEPEGDAGMRGAHASRTDRSRS
jgi:hypothetical protein